MADCRPFVTVEVVLSRRMARWLLTRASGKWAETLRSPETESNGLLIGTLTASRGHLGDCQSANDEMTDHVMAGVASSITSRSFPRGEIGAARDVVAGKGAKTSFSEERPPQIFRSGKI